MCGTVRNVCDWHHLMELIVALLCIPDSAAHACGLHNLTETCNGIVRPYLWSIGACTSLCDWHQCFDLTEIVVTLFCIFNSAAHTRGLRYFIYLCSTTVRPYLQSIDRAQACMTNIDSHLRCKSHWMEGHGFCRMLAEIFFKMALTRFSESAVRGSPQFVVARTEVAICARRVFVQYFYEFQAKHSLVLISSFAINARLFILCCISNSC